MDEALGDCVTDLAHNLNTTTHDLLEGDSWWREKHLQRRGCEIDRELAWIEIAQQLPSADCIRLLEGSGVLARSWMLVAPTERAYRLTDAQVRYGLRLALLSTFPDSRSPSGVCPDCPGAMADDALHHLTCCATRSLATTRHTSLKHITAMLLTKRGCKQVMEEQYFGMTRDGAVGRSDIVATVGDVRAHYDLTVRTATYHRRYEWPSESEVHAAIELDKARGVATQRDALFFWEDYEDEEPHPAVVYVRKVRQLLLERTVGADLASADAEKRSKYGRDMIPLSFSALGCMGRKTRALVADVMALPDKSELSETIAWRRELYGRWSCSLLKSAHLMATHRAGRSMTGY